MGDGSDAAVSIELVANAMDSWTYSKRMPVLLELGILPILQLATLGPAALWIVSTWRKRHRIHDEAHAVRKPETTEIMLITVRNATDAERHQDKSYGGLSLRAVKNKEAV